MKQATLFETASTVWVTLRCPTCGRTMPVRRATWRPPATCEHRDTTHDASRPAVMRPVEQEPA